MSLIIGGPHQKKTKARIRRGLGGLGDSFTQNCHAIAATAYSTENYGYLGGIAAKTGLFASYLDNQGKVGDNSAQFMPRVPLALASLTADLWLLPSRTNDSTTSGMTLDDSKANVMRIVREFMGRPDKWLIVATGTPRFGSKALTGQALIDAKLYRDWVLSYVSRFVPVVNIWDGFTQDMTVDDLHPNIMGQEFITSRFVPVIVANFEWSMPNLSADSGDVFSALRPFGSLHANPMMLGVGGTIPASVNPVAGSVLADSYKCSGSNIAGISTRWYKEPAEFGEAQCIQLSGTMAAAGGFIYLQPSATVVASNLTSGDIIEMLSVPEIVGSSRGILGWEAELIITKPVSGTSTTIYYRSMDKYQEPHTLPDNWKGILESQRYQFDATETVINSRMGLYLAAGVAQDSVVKVSRYSVKKV